MYNLPVYRRKKWDRATYKPTLMARNSMDLTNEIYRTSRNLNELSDVLNKISRELQSSSFPTVANQVDNTIEQMNRVMTVTSIGLVNDLINTCNRISEIDKKIAQNFSNSRGLLQTCQFQLEKIDINGGH